MRTQEDHNRRRTKGEVAVLPRVALVLLAEVLISERATFIFPLLFLIFARMSSFKGVISSLLSRG